MKYLFLLSIVVTLSFLSACGPKEVGHGSSSVVYYGYIPENNSDMVEHARYPISGNRIQERLHMLNQPEVQRLMQNSYRSYINSKMGESLKTPDATYRSPFVEY